MYEIYFKLKFVEHILSINSKEIRRKFVLNNQILSRSPTYQLHNLGSTNKELEENNGYFSYQRALFEVKFFVSASNFTSEIILINIIWFLDLNINRGFSLVRIIVVRANFV